MSVYLACWPVDPDTPFGAAIRAAGVELRRALTLAGLAPTDPPEFTVVGEDGWVGPLGRPGDLLLVSLTPVCELSRPEADRTPACDREISDDAQAVMPIDVTLRERGRAARPARRRAAAAAHTAGKPATTIARTSRLSARTVERLLTRDASTS